MIEFSERFVEDCIAAKPSVFLPFKCKLIGRQVRLAGFRIDLLLLRDDETQVILEIQMNALDRSHLYRSMEYRDLHASGENSHKAIIILMCESLPEKFEPFLKTHDIQLIRFTRHEFLQQAIRSCPKIVAEHVSKPDLTSIGQRKKKSKQNIEINTYDFEPVPWYSTGTPWSIQNHLSSELARLNLSLDDEKLKYRYQALSELSFDQHDIARTILEYLYRPDWWNWDYVLDKDKNTGLKKPKIYLTCFMTQKGNFSVRWGVSRFDTASQGWIRRPREEGFGWERPENELLFLRGCEYLHPSLDPENRFGVYTRWGVIDSIIVSWIASAYNYIKVLSSQIYEVEIINDIELQLSSPEADGIFEKQYVIGWEMVNADEKKRNDLEKRLRSIESRHKIKRDQFLNAYVAGHKKDPRNKADLPGIVLLEVRKISKSIDLSDARKILLLLRELGYPMAEQRDWTIPLP